MSNIAVIRTRLQARDYKWVTRSSVQQYVCVYEMNTEVIHDMVISQDKIQPLKDDDIKYNPIYPTLVETKQLIKSLHNLDDRLLIPVTTEMQTTEMGIPATTTNCFWVWP